MIMTRYKVFNFIKKYIIEYGYSPSYREIGNALGLKSTSTIAMHIKKLESEGLIILHKKDTRDEVVKARIEIPGLKITDKEKIKNKLKIAIIEESDTEITIEKLMEIIDKTF